MIKTQLLNNLPTFLHSIAMSGNTDECIATNFYLKFKENNENEMAAQVCLF